MSPGDKLGRRLIAGVQFGQPIEDFFAIGQRKTVAASGIFLGRLDAETLDRLEPEADGLVGVGPGGGQTCLDCLEDVRKMVAMRHPDDIPTKVIQCLEGGLHRERILGDAAGKLGVVVGQHQQERIHPTFVRKTRYRRERLAGFAFHRGSVAQQADGHPVSGGNFVGYGQPLSHRQR